MTNSRDFHDAQQIQQLGLNGATPAAPRAMAPQTSGLAALGRYVGCADHPATPANSATQQSTFIEEDSHAFA
jgi:hypothetical protein